MRARTHEQLERQNQLLFYYSKEDISEMLIDAETIIDALKYKIKMKEEEIEKLENVIVGLECDVEILSEQIEDDCIAHEEANKWCKEAQELSIRINKAIDYMNNTFDITSMREFFNHLDNIENMLRGE